MQVNNEASHGQKAAMHQIMPRNWQSKIMGKRLARQGSVAQTLLPDQGDNVLRHKIEKTSQVVK